MNLRDLIYSQSQSSQKQSQPVDDPSRNTFSYSQTQNSQQHAQGPADPQYDIATLFHRTNESQNETDDLEQHPKRPRVAKAFATNRKLPIYGDSPLVLQQIDAERHGVKTHRFAPGLDGYVRFAQRDVPFAAFQRDMVRRLWFQCYYGKDFEGAAMALSVLTEIDPLTPMDITAAAQMLRYADRSDPSQVNHNPHSQNTHHTQTSNLTTSASSESIKKLVQGLLKPHPRDADKRHSAIAVSIELLLAQGDIKTARKVLTENITEFTSINRQELKAYDMLVMVANVVQLAQEIGKLLHSPLEVPAIDEIARDPLEFNKCIKIIHMARTATHFTNHKLKAKRQECNRIIQDLKASFVLSVYGSSAPTEHDRMDLEALYIAYMYGVGHESKAIRYLTNLKKTIQTAEMEASVKLDTLSRYYNLLSTYLARYRYIANDTTVNTALGMSAGIATSMFSSTMSNSSVTSNHTGYSSSGYSGSGTSSSSTDNPSYSKIVKALVHQVDATPGSSVVPSLQDVYKLVLLYRIGGIERHAFVERLCEYIDTVGPPMNNQSMSKMTYGSGLHYILWRELATALNSITTTDCIDANAPISVNSDIARYIPGLVSCTSSNNAMGTIINTESHATLALLNKHAWWRTSVLASTALDPFSADSAIPMEKAMELLNITTFTSTEHSNIANNNSSDLNGDAVFEHYNAWKSAEGKFSADLTAAFAARHRSMSEDNDSSSEGSEEEKEVAKAVVGAGTEEDGKGGKRRKKGGKNDADAEEEAFAANTSHDDTEYHSNESGEENGTQTIPTTGGALGSGSGGNNVSGASSSGASSVGYELHRDVLSMAVAYRTSETTMNNHRRMERSILTALGYTSHSTTGTPLRARKYDFSVRRQVVTNPAAATAAPNSLLARNNHPVAQFVLGDAALEMVAYQAQVSARLYGQDNLLTVKVVQILLQHALRTQNSGKPDSNSLDHSVTMSDAVGCTATECLLQLQQHQVHLHRALKIANFLCKENVDTMLPVAQHFTVAEDLGGIKLSSLNQNSYIPHVLGVHV